MIDTSLNTTLSGLGLNKPTAAAGKKELGQEDFLRLMLTQFKNQDPMKPMADGEFLGQIAQFSTVSGIQELQKTVNTLADALTSNQGLQASGLVGHQAMVEADTVNYGGSGGIDGAVQLPQSSDAITVQIKDEAGRLVRSWSLGSQSAGLAAFHWDGLDDSGQPAAVGKYQFSALDGTGGQSQNRDLLLAGRVNSLAFGSSGMTVDLAGLGSAHFSELRQIF